MKLFVCCCSGMEYGMHPKMVMPWTTAPSDAAQTQSSGQADNDRKRKHPEIKGPMTFLEYYR